MQRFAAQIVNVMKSANLYASQGGPIILSQVCLNLKATTVANYVPLRLFFFFVFIWFMVNVD